MRCVSLTVYLAQGNSKGEVRGRNRQKSNSKRVVRNLGEEHRLKGEKSETRPN